MFIGHRSIGYLCTGPCIYARYAAGFEIGLFPRRPLVDGEIEFRFNLSVHWNWLPDRTYQVEDKWREGVASSSWTGRDVSVVAIGRRRWHHRLLLIPAWQDAGA